MRKQNNSTILLLLATIIIIIISSCDPAKKYEKDEAQAIQDFLAINSNKDFELKPLGIYYYEETTGTGELPVSGDTVQVKYVLKLLDGSVFDSNTSSSTTYDFIIDDNQNVVGFNYGISYMRMGGKSVFLVPSLLGYGPNGFTYYDAYYYPHYFPGYTPLVFEVDLVGLKPGLGK